MLYTRRPWFGASVRCSVRLCFCFRSLRDCIDAPTVVRAEVGPAEPDSAAVGAVRARKKKKITPCGIQWKLAHCQNFIRMFQLCSDCTLACSVSVSQFKASFSYWVTSQKKFRTYLLIVDQTAKPNGFGLRCYNLFLWSHPAM